MIYSDRNGHENELEPSQLCNISVSEFKMVME